MAPLKPDLKSLSPNHDLSHLEAALDLIDWPTSRRIMHATAVDGGANVGIWTNVLARHFVTVLAFEPHPDLAASIPQRDEVTVFTVALGPEEIEASLYHGPENEGQYHVGPRKNPEALKVPVRPLDDYEIDDLAFLKLDVEGYEYFALRGAKKTIERCRPLIMIEENGLCARYGLMANAAGELLDSWGYERVDRLNKDEIWRPV